MAYSKSQGSCFAGTTLFIQTDYLLKTYEESNQWLADLYHWYERSKVYVNEKAFNPDTGRYWYRHKMLRQTTSLIIKAIPNMFHYLDDPQIPYTTNRLESFFGHLKKKLDIHRGLRPQAKRNFIKCIYTSRINGNEFFPIRGTQPTKKPKEKLPALAFSAVNLIADKLPSAAPVSSSDLRGLFNTFPQIDTNYF